MLFKVSDAQFLTYAARLSRAYANCTTLEDYKKLDKSFDILFRQHTLRKNSKDYSIIDALINQRKELLDTFKGDLYARLYN